MELTINNEQQQIDIPVHIEEMLNRAVETVLKRRNDNANEMSIVFCDDEFIQELNQRFRGHNKSTDVLSFAAREHSSVEPGIVGGPDDLYLGDIFISVETAVRQASDYGHSLEREIVYLAVHGVLHLLGMDHLEEEEREQMRQEEEAVMATLGLSR